jgi:hypothetical protein
MSVKSQGELKEKTLVVGEFECTRESAEDAKVLPLS